MQKINILNINILKIKLEGLLALIVDAVKSNQATVLLYGNIHTFNLAYKTPWLQDFLNQSTVFCDGVGVQWGAKLLGEELPERFTPPDWFPNLCELCVEHDFSLYLIGTKPGITEKVAQIYQEKYPKLKIVGTGHGYFNKDKNSAENQQVLDKINQANPDILVIGFGMPVQEKWLIDNLPDMNAKVYLTVGAMFDFLAGETQRGPKWMTDNGLEWLSRLFIEPKRLWKRYLIGNPLFFWRILKQKLGFSKGSHV